MALNTFKCNRPMPLHFKGLTGTHNFLIYSTVSCKHLKRRRKSLQRHTYLTYIHKLYICEPTQKSDINFQARKREKLHTAKLYDTRSHLVTWQWDIGTSRQCYGTGWTAATNVTWDQQHCRDVIKRSLLTTPCTKPAQASHGLLYTT